MTSRTRPSFWRAYVRLSEPNRLAAQRAYAFFAQNPDHPSLRFKKLGAYDHVWSVRINEQCRAIGERYGDTIILTHAGTLPVTFQGAAPEFRWALKELNPDLPSDWSAYQFLTLELKSSTPQRKNITITGFLKEVHWMRSL